MGRGVRSCRRSRRARQPRVKEVGHTQVVFRKDVRHAGPILGAHSYQLGVAAWTPVSRMILRHLLGATRQ